MRPRAIGATLVLLLAAGCEPLPRDKASPVPVNACPAHPCGAYDASPPAACDDAGTCAVAQRLPPLYLVVGLPTYSPVGPSMTLVLTTNGAPKTSALCAYALPSCDPDSCDVPPWTTNEDAYAVTPSATFGPLGANWYLGNPNSTTSLPATASYRLLIGPDLADALDMGLPVLPYMAQPDPTPGAAVPGPFGTGPFRYVAAMPPGCYRRTVQPYAPLSSAYPPEIRLWPKGQLSLFNPTTSFDVTSSESGLSSAQAVPTFDISRAQGLDGWTAYLRNGKSGQITSIVAALHGSLDKGVRLLTLHAGDPVVVDPTKLDALSGLELVIAPPPGTPLPAEVLRPQGAMGKSQSLGEPLPPYPSLPTPILLSGRIQTQAGVPVPSEIVFTAIDVFNQNGDPFPSNSFEFQLRASTGTDARTGAETYSVLLPRGDYQMTVRPTDGANAALVASFKVPLAAGATGDVEVLPLAKVEGQALLADGRPVAEGQVEAVPVACPQMEPPSTSAACMPRPAQVQAGDDGTFALALDPGSYTLRVTPVDGTRFPWVTQPLVVGTADMTLPTVQVPAPVVLSRTITSGSAAAGNAIVRIFTQPDAGSPVELGRAVTDESGHFDAYLPPQPP
jgi:hypothetical protein